jgi:hypothetical protein
MIKIEFGDRFIELHDGTWIPSDESLQPLANLATTLSRPPFYEYTPDHGAYGPLLAKKVSEKIGGEVVLPETEETMEPPPGVMF